jgi:undecaprenyl diphosphate synthase
VPRHVAIVMDGNGRWARKRLLPRVFGHKVGVDTLVKTVLACADRGIEHLTVFAFSSENWKRPADEVSFLMSLVLIAVEKYLDKLARAGVRIRMIGDRDQLTPKLREACDKAERGTAANTRINLWIAFAYGGRWDIVQAARRAIASGIAPDALDETTFARFLALADAPDPDLLIRTGGEVRISNFLLWQAAYAELVFSDCLWPDFDEAQLDAAIAAFAQRDRRFGLVKDEPSGDAAAAVAG